MGIIVKFITGGLMRLVPLFLAGLTFITKGFKNFKFKDLKKYIPYLIGAFVLVFAYIFFKKKTKLSNIESLSDGQKKGYLVASQICDYLGTAEASSWWHPEKWFEDEKDASDLMIKNKSVIKDIESEYNKISKSGNLKKDIQRLFTPDQKEYLFTKLWGI